MRPRVRGNARHFTFHFFHFFVRTEEQTLCVTDQSPLVYLRNILVSYLH